MKMKEMIALLLILFSFGLPLFSIEISTRPAKKEDIHVLYDLICELAVFEGKDLASLPLTKENLYERGFGESPYFFVEVAELENKVVGYALYFYGFSAHQGSPFLYVDDLYVKEKYRGQGIGTRLLKQLACYAKQQHCCRLEWHVFDWNESGIAFYEKLDADLRKDLILVRLEKDPMDRLAVND